MGALNPKEMAVKGPKMTPVGFKLGCGGCEPQRNDPKGLQIGVGALNPKGMAVKGPKLGWGGFKAQRNGSKGSQIGVWGL